MGLGQSAETRAPKFHIPYIHQVGSSSPLSRGVQTCVLGPAKPVRYSLSGGGDPTVFTCGAPWSSNQTWVLGLQRRYAIH